VPPSPYTAYGLYDERSVTSFGWKSSSDGVYVTMHVADYAGNWTEIGWSDNNYIPSSNCSGNPGYTVFAYNSSIGQWWCGGAEFPIGPGNYIWLAIESTGAPYNYWYDYLWWSPYWYLVADSALATPYASGNGSPNIDIEIYTYASGSLYNFPTLPPAYSLGAQLETSLGGPWINWNTFVPNTSILWDEYPYGIFVPQEWQSWYGCGPLGVVC